MRILTVPDMCRHNVRDKAILFLLATAIILKIFFVVFNLPTLFRLLSTVVRFFLLPIRRRSPLFSPRCCRLLDYFYVTVNFSVFAMQSRKVFLAFSHRTLKRTKDDAKEVDFMMLSDGYQAIGKDGSSTK